MVFSAAAFTLLRYELPRLYTDERALLALAAQILPLAAAFQLSDGTQVVAGGVLRGMGRRRRRGLVNLLGYYASRCRSRTRSAFASQLGLAGIWIALAVGLLSVACAMLFWIRQTLHTPVTELQLRVDRAA